MKTFLKINGKQSVKLRSDTIKFKNHFKQLAVPFKTYVDFESILKWIKRNNRKNNIPCSFSYKVVCVDNSFNKPVVLCRRKNAINKFIEAILKEYCYCRQIVNLIKIFSCLQKIKKDFSQVSNAGYATHYFLQKIMK